MVREAVVSESESTGGSRWLIVLAVVATLWLTVALVGAFRGTGGSSATDPISEPVAEAATEDAVEAPNDPVSSPGSDTAAVVAPEGISRIPRALPGRSIEDLRQSGIDARIAYLSDDGLVVIDTTTGMANVLAVPDQPVEAVPGMRIARFAGHPYGIVPELLSVSRIDVSETSGIISESQQDLLYVRGPIDEAGWAPIRVLAPGGASTTYSVPVFSSMSFDDQGILVTASGASGGAGFLGRRSAEPLSLQGQTVLDVESETLLLSRCMEYRPCELLVRDRADFDAPPVQLGSTDGADSGIFNLSPSGTRAIHVRPDGSADVLGARGPETVDRLADTGVVIAEWSPDDEAVAWIDLTDTTVTGPRVLHIVEVASMSEIVVNFASAGLPAPIGPTVITW